MAFFVSFKNLTTMTNHSKHTEDTMTDQEFDILLQDFLHAEEAAGLTDGEDKDDTEDNSLHNTMTQQPFRPDSPMKRGQRHGHTYLIPRTDRELRYTFSSMSVSYGNSQAELQAERPRLYAEPGKQREENIYIYYDNLSRKVSDIDATIDVWLYREGHRQPLCHICEEPAEGDWLTDLSKQLQRLETGNYFLLFDHIEPNPAEWRVTERLGGCFCYDFRVLQQGRSLPHPRLQSVTLKLDEKATGKLHLSPQFDAQPADGHEVVFHCLTDNYLSMGSGTDTITPTYIWMPGHYLLVAEHNGMPYTVIPFHTDGQRISIGQQRPVTPDSDEWLALEAQQGGNAYYWKQMCLTPRLGAIRRNVLDCLRLQQFNHMRQRWTLKSLSCYGHYLFVTDEHSLVKPFARIAFQCTDIRMEDATQWIENYQRQITTDTGNDPLSGCRLCTVCFYNIGILATAEGQPLLRQLKNKLENQEEWSLCLCGNARQIDCLLENAPVLRKYFPPQNRIDETPASAMQMVHYLQSRLESCDFQLSERAARRINTYFTEACAHGQLTHWGKNELDRYLNECLLLRCRNRLLTTTAQTDPDHTPIRKSNVSTIAASDVERPVAEVKGTAGFAESMDGLNKLVGLDKLKERLQTVFNRVRFDEQRRTAGLKPTGRGLSHMVFTGNPGTGKTTVAKLLGQACHSLGLLSKGEVVVTERSRLVGRYIGDTERNTLEVLEAARGNVLFIDEAYTLYAGPDNRRDFGIRVVDTLLTVLSAPNPDMLVIMAGYEREMEALLSTNPGLRERFSCILHFDDYTPEELMEIACRRLQELECRLTDKARLALDNAIRQAVTGKDRFFSNARWMCRFVDEGLLSALSNRLMSGQNAPTHADLQTIEACDVEAACRIVPYCRPSSATPAIGFRK